ncbi:ExeM/NucH family extracellular endonuclease [Marinobacterium stanieri]|uniref:Endonuclease/exonuclease/phosphatase domain-containing protein n=1 Tax=Marinobacterium stanieri TaxID=49186 RepID=A0A1N6NE82_9GAMM|nr:ExeM/NucH family extracellular endonuclease [Marinobacterium stanieri]SIP90317.1 hypothetical protein SAMN05421647_101251 [Marinobacterium stanieri]
MIRINEFQPNPQGTDPQMAVFELQGEPGTLFTGWITSIEGDNSSATIDSAYQISGTFDEHGLLTVEVPDLENPSFTVVLSSEFNGALGNTFSLLNTGAFFGRVHDALGVPDASADASYLFGAALGGADFAYTGDEPRLVFRDSLSGDWYAINDPDNGQVIDINGNVVAPDEFGSDPASGTDTFGSANPSRSAPAANHFVESFEQAPGTTYFLFSDIDDGSFDFFGRFASPDNTNSARDDFQSGFDGGYAIFGQDHDGEGGASTQVVSIPGIDISGYVDLAMAVRVGALSSEPTFQNYEAGDGIRIFASVDSGARVLVAEFAPPVSGSGDLRLDTDGDGIGDGEVLTTALSRFVIDLPNGGSLLDLEIEMTSDASYEPLVIDKVEVGEMLELAPEPEGPEAVFIHQIQGSGTDVAISGEVQVQGVVTGVYDESDELKGFFVQEEDAHTDNDSATSEGIFVYLGSNSVDGLAEGQIVTVTGVAEDYFGMSQINVTDGGSVTIDDATDNLNLVSSTLLELPAPGRTDAAATFEAVEGMLVNFTDTLVVSEYYELARTGQIVLQDEERSYQYTQLHEPNAEGYAAYQDDVAASRIVIDDLNNLQNSDEIYYPGAEGFSVDNFIRGGDQVEDLTGILHWSWAGYQGSDAWVVRPTEAAPVEFTESNPRTDVPEEVGGRLKVASFNVLNLFATIDDGAATTQTGMEPRGADSEAELQRQLDKIVAALSKMDADVIGLIEIENDNDETLALLVDELNAALGTDVYDYVPTGVIGSDAIKVGFIYDSSSVRIANDGEAVAVLDTPEFMAPLGTGDKNRPAVAVTFEELATGSHFTAVNNHLKSKGSPVAGEDDPGIEDGQGNGSETRKMAADVLADWLATNPTGAPDDDVLILGDLNAYAKEEPLQELREGADDQAGTEDDFIDLAAEMIGDDAYSYVFDGQLGTLDYALANQALLPQVTGVTQWHINADEVSLLDYNDDIQDPTERGYEAKPSGNELYADDPYRSSDHDPVIVGLDLAPEWNLIRGEDGRNDRIKGTDGSDLIMSLGGRVDRLWGLEGEDYFAVGHEMHNGVRETDMIMDFEGGKDSLILMEGAEIRSMHGSERSMVIFLEGDRDMIHLLGTNLSAENLNIRYEPADLFL